MSITTGHVKYVDTTKERLRPYLDELETLPFVKKARLVPSSKRAVTAETGAVIALTTASGETRLPIALKRSHLSREVAEHLVNVGRQGSGLLVLAPRVGSQLGELFAHAGINFMDLAGNCHVRIGDTYLARIQGQRSAQREPGDRSLRAPAFSVLFALAADAKLLQATTRTLAEAAGSVSPQTAADMRAKLVASGIAFKTKGGFRWAPAGRKQLLEMFLFSYPHLISGFRIGRFRAKQRDIGQLETELEPRLDALGEWRYADLLDEGHDRAREAAGEVYRQYLQGLESDT